MGYESKKAWRKRNPDKRNQAKIRNYNRGAQADGFKIWTREEDLMVLAHEITDRELSFKINRSIQAIQHHRSELKKRSDESATTERRQRSGEDSAI